MRRFSDYFETQITEIYFNIPKNKILTFNIQYSNVEGQGLLSEYGWKNNEDAKIFKLLYLIDKSSFYLVLHMILIKLK
jgi:hypothetical protein